MPTVDINGLALFYQDAGQGEPVLLLAGLGMDHTLWQPVVRELEEHHRCIAPDNRGVGRTDKPLETYTIPQMARDTLGLLDLLGVDRVHAVGLSMGGMIAQEMARMAPERMRTMALVDTAALVDGRTQAVLAAWKVMIRRLERREYFLAIAPWLFGPGGFQRPETIERFAAAAADPAHWQPEYAFDRQADAMAAFDSRPYLRDLRVPTAAIVGENDLLTPPQAARPLAESIKGGQLVIIPAAGHLSPLEQPPAFLEALETLWRRGKG